MKFCEDFGDEPAVEERLPFGTTPEEMAEVWTESRRLECCEFCGEEFAIGALNETGHFEYYTMDIDPGTRICEECLESQRELHTPDDPLLFDGLTPVFVS